MDYSPESDTTEHACTDGSDSHRLRGTSWVMETHSPRKLGLHATVSWMPILPFTLNHGYTVN